MRLEYAPQYCPSIPSPGGSRKVWSSVDDTPGANRRSARYAVPGDAATALGWYRSALRERGWAEDASEDPQREQSFSFAYPSAVRDPPVTSLFVRPLSNGGGDAEVLVTLKITDSHSMTVWCPAVMP